MYTVTFKRKDEQPDEIYYYQNYADAVYHLICLKMMTPACTIELN